METPDWAKQLHPGRWYAISGDEPESGLSPTTPGSRYLEDGDPAADPELNPNRSLSSSVRRLLGRYVKAPWSGRCSFAAITEAWNGAVFAGNCGDSGAMVIFGGGHNDYFGSDVHTFDLASREWRRVSDGYVTGGKTEYGAGCVYPEGEYPDGSPLPPHTYGYVQYDAAANELLIFKSQLELGEDVKPLAIPHLFNLSRGQWRRGPCHPVAYLGAGGWTAWDDRRRILWGNSGDGSNSFLGFSPDEENPDGTFGRWGECFEGKLPGSADHCVMAYDPRADRLVVVDHVRNRLGILDPAIPTQPLLYPPCSNNPRLSPYAALEYSPRLDSMIYYSASNGANLWRVRRELGANQTLPWSACHWQSLLDPANNLDPITDAAQLSRHSINRDHTFGRFRVASYAEMDLAVLVRHVDTPVYVMRLLGSDSI